MSVSEMTDEPCPKCHALLLRELVAPPERQPKTKPTEPQRRDTLTLTHMMLCPQCGWTAPG
jgi:hypothetical protein